MVYSPSLAIKGKTPFMNKSIRSYIRFFVKNDFLWFFIKPFIKIGDYIHSQRQIAISKQLENDRQIIEVLKEPVVRYGPFKGLIYPEFIYHNDRFFSKIMGSYEMEISDLIENLCKKNFDQIINIGCGDGYYAVGFARRIPSAVVYAYDSSKRARKHCAQMASLNRVAGSLKIGNSFAAGMFDQLHFLGHQLILCDCEGDEKKIFTAGNLSYFRNCELLIEVHDFIDITTGDYLKEIFSATHIIRAFKSIDDLSKARNYHFAETDMLDIGLRKIIFEEGRPAPMEWYYFIPKQTIPPNE